jgi:xylulokinase
MAVVCAIDVGTTRIKAMLFGEDLSPGPVVSAPSVLNTPVPGAVEVDAEALWTQTLTALREIAAASSDKVAGLAITNQRATVFVLDDAGNPLGPGLSWQDGRGSEQLTSWMAGVGAARFTQITGLVPSTIWSLAKILWWRAGDLPAGARFATIQDWLLHRLGAPDWVLDHADASLTGLFNIGSLEWDGELMQAAGLTQSQLPSLAPSGKRVGKIDAGVAALTGLPTDTELILGGGDQQCADLGAGALHPGMAVANLGTAGVITVTTDRPVVDPYGRLVCVAHVVPDRWILEGLENSYGGAHGWGQRLFGDRLVKLAADVPVGSRGLICLPYLAGIGAPDYDSDARGVLLGLTLAHGSADIARSILEGTTIELVRILDAARELVGVDRLVASGGGANSPLLLEMLANLAGVSVTMVPHPETTLLGAGLLAWVALGRWPDAVAAAAALPFPAETVYPAPARAGAYRALYDRYLDALRRLRQAGLLDLSAEAQNGDS